MLTTVLAGLAAAVLIVGAAARIPAALADFLRACLPVVHAARELHHALTHPDAPPPAVLPASASGQDAER
ncbi:hypothetical protein [Actinomadura macrotermitis]|uniref:KASH domain-containing protein n=1 Tax=Actinomadura macrotermitis TaxID=2585200 RepID=A0A7K0C7W7_9ACTN|nr:hypothetical protein [Actinomadura macrotermitis]MQY08884.1 hypothetical protein [Actinomadura macrotermitis]